MRTLAYLSFGFILAACGRSEMSSPSSVSSDAVTVDFHIVEGTANKAWNTKDTAVMMKVGDTLRIYNDDSIGHQLHTNGAPFNHGDLIPAHTFRDTVTKKAFNPTVPNQEIYDHLAGPSAPFYIRVAAAK